uniref:Uncharacterized protein n=1 Tax=Rhizophagus irregularis (strain DAOM 181602 / DAOM 197198 / MUCL 43194) TaxID=747089 RepID=U9SZK8_RHIID
MIVEIETKYTTCGKLIGIESSKGILDAWTREESSPNFDYAFIEDLDFGKFSTLICLESGDCLGSTNGSRNCGFKELSGLDPKIPVFQPGPDRSGLLTGP